MNQEQIKNHIALETYILNYLHRKPLIKCSQDIYTVRLLGDEVVIEGRKTRKKAVRGVGNTLTDAFENAIKQLN